MLFTPDITAMIVVAAEVSDRMIRAELIEGEIATENDYTSNFIGQFRRAINALGVPGLRAKIKVLNPSAERKLGADACVILQSDSEFKVGIFEAKWPRLSTRVNSWDSEQKKSGGSHFHSQLRRQYPHSQTLAIWEMFYCEYPFESQTALFPAYGSACVWHRDALRHSVNRKDVKRPWRDTELKQLLKSHKVSISEVIEDICNCSEGTPYPIGNYEKAFDNMSLPHSALVIEFKPGVDRKD